jgi:hypothetical protein
VSVSSLCRAPESCQCPPPPSGRSVGGAQRTRPLPRAVHRKPRTSATGQRTLQRTDFLLRPGLSAAPVPRPVSLRGAVRPVGLPCPAVAHCGKRQAAAERGTAAGTAQRISRSTLSVCPDAGAALRLSHSACPAVRDGGCCC